MSHKRAFTLVEILVSTVILSIIIGSLYVVFKMSMDSWKKSNERLEIFQNAKIILEQISKELQSAVLKGDTNTYFLLGDDLNPDEITFVCPILTDQGNEYDLCQIKYYLSSSKLMRYIDRNVSGSGTSTTMAEGILDLQFKYWDTATATWSTSLDTWNSKTAGAQAGRLPKAIKIDVVIKEQNNRFISVIYLSNS